MKHNGHLLLQFNFVYLIVTLECMFWFAVFHFSLGTVARVAKITSITNPNGRVVKSKFIGCNDHEEKIKAKD